MLRFFRAPRTTLASRAVAKQVVNGQTVIMHRVRPRRPLFRMRNILVGTFVTLACFKAYDHFVISPFIRALVKMSQELDKQDGEEEELEDIFIAFPFTTEMVRSSPYRGSDPEWQGYIKFNQEKRLQARVRMDAVNMVQSAVENHPLIARRTGKGIRAHKWWLEFHYPYAPPPVFERSGIIIGEDEIYWGSKEVPPETIVRTQRVLWPSTLALSLWSFGFALVKQNALDVARQLGYDAKPPPPPPSPLPPALNPAFQRTLQQMQGQIKPKSEGSSGGNSPQKQQPADQTPAADGNPATVNKNDLSKGSADAQTNEEKSVMSRVKDFYPSDRIQEVTKGPLEQFRKKWSQSFRPLRSFPPRGSIEVLGIIQLESTRALITIDFRAYWDPQTRQYDRQSVSMALRSIQDKKQSPLRG